MINHIGTKPIKTERLFLRKFTLNDIPEAFEKWTSKKDCDFWGPPHKNINETKLEISKYVKNYFKKDWYMWAVIMDNKLIGLVCGNLIDENIKSICLGYCLTKSYWNKGITTEACKALIKYFFKMGFNRIFSQHNPKNPASGKVMQKCGLQYEGLIRGGSIYRGKICDCLQYALLKSDKIKE